MIQVTDWFVVPETVAFSCKVCPGSTFLPGGVTVTTIGAPIRTIRAVDGTAPGSGFSTISCADVSFCDAIVVPLAVNSVDETNLVVSVCPASVTFAPLTNFAPLMVIEKLPTGTAVGEMAVTVGIGFSSEISVLPESVLSDAELASMLTESGVGRAAGAL